MTNSTLFLVRPGKPSFTLRQRAKAIEENQCAIEVIGENLINEFIRPDELRRIGHSALVRAAGKYNKKAHGRFEVYAIKSIIRAMRTAIIERRAQVHLQLTCE